MAQRLATEYVKICLRLSEAEMSTFTNLFTENQIGLQVKVLDNGNQEVVLVNETNNDVKLHFTRCSTGYACETSCKLTDPKLVTCMREAIAQLKGDAIVNRVYAHFTMEYRYEQGKVVRITELSDKGERIVYERQGTLVDLEHLFQSLETEREISHVYHEIDQLLDERYLAVSMEILLNIDRNLSRLSHRLFVLEA